MNRKLQVFLLAFGCMACLAGTRAVAQDCSPTMDCTLKVDDRDCRPVDNTPCNLAQDTRNCDSGQDTRSCGHDVNLPFNGRIHVNDPVCEAAKAAENARRAVERGNCEAAKATQNTLNAAQKAACESAKAAHNTALLAARPACAAAKAAQNALYGAQKATCEANKTALKAKCEADKADFARKSVGLVKKIDDEAVEVGLRALPGDIRKGVVHLSAEAKREIDKYPVVASVLETTLALTQPLLANEIKALLAHMDCDPGRVIGRLSTSPQEQLDGPSKNLGALTTPLKDGNISGWDATGCWADGTGVLIRDAAHSSDKFYTIDVQLESLSVQGQQAGAGRYLRIEVEPVGGAHTYANRNSLKKNDKVRFAGPVLIDTDLPSPFVEVHPIDDLAKQ